MGDRLEHQQYIARDSQVPLQYKWSSKGASWGCCFTSSSIIEKKPQTYTNIPTPCLLFLPQIQIISLHQSLLPVKIQIKQHEVPIPIWPLYFYSPNNATGARKFSALNPVDWLNHHVSAVSISAISSPFLLCTPQQVTTTYRHIRRWLGYRELKCRPWCRQFTREIWWASTSSYSNCSLQSLKLDLDTGS